MNRANRFLWKFRTIPAVLQRNLDDILEARSIWIPLIRLMEHLADDRVDNNMEKQQ